MKHENVQDRLIERTIHIIGTRGLDKTTTKAIVNGTGINEVYIYRHFANKEDLLKQTFAKLDKELLDKLEMHFPVMYTQGLSMEKRCRFMFDGIWKFLLGNQDKCFAYIRYYYSPYFAKHSMEEHKVRYAGFVSKFDEGFLEEADTWMILNLVLSTMLNFAVQVYEGELGNNEDTEEHVFRVVYHAIKQYFR